MCFFYYIYRFLDVIDDSGKGKFSYSPCNGFTEGNCTNAAVSINTNRTSLKERIYTKTTSNFEINEKHKVFLLYNVYFIRRPLTPIDTHTYLRYLGYTKVIHQLYVVFYLIFICICSVLCISCYIDWLLVQTNAHFGLVVHVFQ